MVNPSKSDINKTALLIFSVLILISIAGRMQAYSFSEKTEQLPVVYDVIKPIPFWSFWVLTLAPIAMMSSAYATIFGSQPEPLTNEIAFWIVMIVYYYIIAILLTRIFENLKKGKNKSTTNKQF